MARSKEVGSVYFTFSVPIKTGMKVYELSQEIDISVSEVLRTLCNYAAERAHVDEVSRNVKAILFSNTTD